MCQLYNVSVSLHAYKTNNNMVCRSYFVFYKNTRKNVLFSWVRIRILFVPLNYPYNFYHPFTTKTSTRIVSTENMSVFI